MKRRTFIKISGKTTSWMVLGLASLKSIHPHKIEKHGEEMKKYDKHEIEKWNLSQEEWKAKLSKGEFYVLREEGTEAPFSHDYNEEKRKGIFHCRGCELELFTSEMKYDSGTGWPSFFDKIEGHLETKVDYKLLYPRKEYHCSRCGGHQGHVFRDGPAPTYERWCNNGIALKFVAEEV